MDVHASHARHQIGEQKRFDGENDRPHHGSVKIGHGADGFRFGRAGRYARHVDRRWRMVQRAYVVGSSLGLVPWPAYAQTDYTVVLCDGVWRRALPVQHFFPMTAGTGSQIDLPRDLPTDLAPSRIALTVHNPTGKAAEFAAVIFGPCVNPSFRIGGNTYAVDVTVPEGGHVSLSATGLRKSITLTAENGDVSDVFDKGVRGTAVEAARMFSSRYRPEIRC